MMNFFHTHISDKVYEKVESVLRSGYLSEGDVVAEFENELSRKLGLINPVAVNSGTSALHLALVLADVGPGDEVILPAQTFVATGLVILMQGATPVFADIQYDTGNISPQDIKHRITKRTKAIMPVHWGGYPCDMDEINQIADKYHLVVIGDAAHALGAIYKTHPIAKTSELTAFSFQAIKHLTTGDGGALSCLWESDYLLAKKLRWFGIDRAKSKPSILGEREYDIDTIGYKYHMNNLAAAVGLGNLDGFRTRLLYRHQIAEYYRNELADVPGLELLKADYDRTHAYWLFTMLVERREDFIRKLAEYNIPASVVHLSIDRNSVFGGLRDDLPNQALWNTQQVSIPIHEGLCGIDIHYIADVIQGGW